MLDRDIAEETAMDRLEALELRAARADELPAVLSLIALAFLPLAARLPSRPTALDETEDSLRQRLRAGGRIHVASRQDALLACMITAPLGATAAECKRVCAHPDWQGLGLGKRLMLHGEARLKQQGVVRVQLATRASMPANLRFYQALGYRVVAEEPYPAGIADLRIILEKQL